MPTIVSITPPFITLNAFLKLTNYISLGSEAKYFLLTHQVFVNEVHENRRGRKLYADDLVVINNEQYLIKYRA